LQFAGAQDSITYLKLSMRGRPHTRVQAGMLSNVYGMLDCVAASWSKKGQKMPCDARDNTDSRVDEDEEDGEDGEGVQDDEDGEDDKEDNEDEDGEQQQQQLLLLQLQKQNPSDCGGLPQTQYRQNDTRKRAQTNLLPNFTTLLPSRNRCEQK